MIDGVILTPLKQIFDERGKVMHMLREDSPVFSRFGEIYFSYSHAGIVKAWHLHKEMILNYAVIYGAIKIVLYDDRPESRTCGEIQEIFLSPENYMLLTVPPMIWNGFKGIGSETSIVANCSSIPHNDNEMIRREPTDADIPYNWNLQHR